MSTAVTMRPLRLSEPATSTGPRGTRLIAVWAMTSCTLRTGTPNDCLPIRMETSPSLSAGTVAAAEAEWVMLRPFRPSSAPDTAPSSVDSSRTGSAFPLALRRASSSSGVLCQFVARPKALANASTGDPPHWVSAMIRWNCSPAS